MLETIRDFNAQVTKALKSIGRAIERARPITAQEELLSRLRSRSEQPVNKVEKLLK
jgi:hypothetical protein